MRNLGIVYDITGQRDRGTISRYHGKPDPLFLNKTKHKIDVAGLKAIDKRNTLFVDGQDITSKFTVGFEVEKNTLHRGALKEYELFCGFERDGSCGYEAVTHVLPLLPGGQWRTKVFDMMHKAERIIDDRFSPSNQKCGGHITVAVEGLNGAELNTKVRKFAGILLALFRMRLKNVYCGANRRMQDVSDEVFNSASSSYSYNSRESHWKYQTALVKGNCLEFRLISRFESVKQMMRRYELIYEIVNFAVNKENKSYNSFLKSIEPIIVSMYNGDKDKANEVIELSKKFQKFINDGTISEDISRFLD